MSIQNPDDFDQLLQRYEALSGHEPCWTSSRLAECHARGCLRVPVEGICIMCDRDAQGNEITTQVVWDEGKTAEEVAQALKDTGVTPRLSREDHLQEIIDLM